MSFIARSTRRLGKNAARVRRVDRTFIAQGPRRRLARVLLVGSGRMGQIRASIIHANPRMQLCGIVDPDLIAASVLSERYQVT